MNQPNNTQRGIRVRIVRHFRYLVSLIKYKFMTARKREIASFLSNYPLYKKFEIEQDEVPNIFITLAGQGFNTNCEDCKCVQLFFLDPVKINENAVKRIPSEMTGSYLATCGVCRNYTIELHINRFESIREKSKSYLRKVGQNPAFQLQLRKSINEHLSEEDKLYYSKGLQCFNGSLGIAAFSYFRRVVENEVRRLYKENGNELPKDFKAATDIIEDSFKLLPSSLQDLGYNPIKTIWGFLSWGLHELSEDLCLELCSDLERLLSLIIDRLNSEKNEVKAAKESLKRLEGMLIKYQSNN